MATPNAAPVYDGQYAAELRATASAMVQPGKGLLACDESTGTVGTRLEANGMENTEENRQIWRNLLFTALKIGVEAGCPTDLAIDVASQDLARYARICQE